MRTKYQLFPTILVVIIAAPLLLAQSWTLPHTKTVKDDGPRTYRFNVEYFTADTRGEIVSRQRLTAYTRALPTGDAIWKNVVEEKADGPTSPYGPPEKREFMEGFHYQRNATKTADTLAPDFFKNFPPTAVFERNLVWDTQMIEDFGQTHFEDLKLNQPYHTLSSEAIKLPDVGTFRNQVNCNGWASPKEMAKTAP